MEKIPRVGVGVIIRRNNKILLGKRLNSHGSETWSPPGGHLEFMETIEACVKREVMEETGCLIANIQPPAFTEEFHIEEDKHYLNFMLTADWQSNEPQRLEPDKCAGWEWFFWDDLPSPLFLPLRNHIDQGFNPFE